MPVHSSIDVENPKQTIQSSIIYRRFYATRSLISMGVISGLIRREG